MDLFLLYLFVVDIHEQRSQSRREPQPVPQDRGTGEDSSDTHATRAAGEASARAQGTRARLGSFGKDNQP